MDSRVLKRLILFFALFVAVGAAFAAAPPQAAKSVNFAANDPLLDLGDALKLYHAPASSAQAGSVWYMMTASNDSVRPAARILLAGQPPGASVRFFPPRARPAIRQIASSDAEVTVEPARAYGRRAFRVVVPPASSATLAIRVSDADPQPAVEAWSEPALVAHDRQLAIFFAAVAGLMAASLAVTAGLAAMTGHAAPRWAAITILAVFLTRLAAAGVFDAGWFTAVGGPYGFSIMFAGFTLAAGLYLTDVIAPVEELWPQIARHRRNVLLGIVALSVLSFLGLPGAMLLVEVAVVAGAGVIAAYLVHRGRLGAQAARVASPAAVVFSLVATAAAVTALGGFRDNPAAPAIVGGFAAAGAVLLALAVAAGEGLAVTRVLGSLPRLMLRAEEPSQDLALHAIGASHQGVFDLDLQSQTLRLSRDAASLIGVNGAVSMTHAAWVSRIHPEDRETYKQALVEYSAHSGLAFRMEMRVRSESGRYPWLELRATMVGESAAERCLGLASDITARKESEAVAARPEQDSLTGLGSRAALLAALGKISGAGAGLALLDIDRFKSIHATLGDAGGDAVLANMAQKLDMAFAQKGAVFRAGGDSFALLFAQCDDAEKIGDAAVTAAEGPVIYGGRTIFVSVSAGVAALDTGEDPNVLLAHAERALAESKKRGGGCATVYTADLAAPSDAVALEADLRRALETDEFEVFYQPIVSLDDGTVAGFEALLRWRHPQKGLIGPDEFIAHCEETGLIVAIGRRVLERAADNLAQWQKYFPLTPALFASVNLSRRQLLDGELAPFLSALLDKSAVAENSLKVEVTESAAGSQGGAQGALLALRDLGVGLAMDDFGTGLSALSELKDLPFDTIKIDRSFLTGGVEPDGAVILASVVKLAQDLGRIVVVEGVETEKDALWLQERGCHFAQGYYFSPPLASDEVLPFIAEHYRTEPLETSGSTGVS